LPVDLKMLPSESDDVLAKDRVELPPARPPRTALPFDFKAVVAEAAGANNARAGARRLLTVAWAPAVVDRAG
jgi:hypothetical protein